MMFIKFPVGCLTVKSFRDGIWLFEIININYLSSVWEHVDAAVRADNLTKPVK